MRRFFNLKFLLALVFGVGIVAVMSFLSNEDDADDDLVYGDPDGETSEGEVSSFVD